MHTAYIHHLPAEWEQISVLFSALGDPQRQRLLLAFEDNERLTAGQLSSASPLNRTTVSHHLKILRQAGVLCAEKQGKEVYYSVNRTNVRAALDSVLNYLKD